MVRYRARSLRASLTLSHIAVVLVVLATYAVVVFAFVSRNLSRALDDQLRADFQWAASMADLQPDGTLKWFDEDVDGDTDGPWLRVSKDGRVIFLTAVAERNGLPIADSLIDRPDGSIVTVSSPARARILTARATVQNRSVVLQVARSERKMRAQLSELALLLGLVLPVGVVLAAAGGYLLAQKALMPIEKMASRAAAITADRLSDRLEVPNPENELGRLATVFNEMLGRLESSFGEIRQFTANVSHQLRTPLTALRLAGEVGARDARDVDASRAVISDMLVQIDRLCALVDRLLALSRAQADALSRQPVNLVDVVAEVLDELGVLADEKGQTLTFQAPEYRVATVADSSLLREAVANLIDNAVKYTPIGGAIRVTVSRTDTEAVLDVRDGGPGIPGRVGNRVFDRFYRTDERLPEGSPLGHGLGLAIAKWAVEANGGTIAASSSPAGSTFRIGLPLSTGRSLDPSVRPSLTATHEAVSRRDLQPA
jgi:heavy metal sensor kinase